MPHVRSESNANRIRIVARGPKRTVWVSGFAEQRQFFLSSARSPDDSFTLAWRDSPNWSQSVEPPTPGDVLLFLHERLAFAAQVPRPFYGAVANNGLTAVVDETFDLSVLQSELLVFDRSGKLHRRLRAKSNANGVALSPCGRFLLLGFLRGNEGDGAPRCILFDLASRKQLWSVETWQSSENAVVDTEAQVVVLTRTRAPDFVLEGRRLSLSDGSWLDSDFLRLKQT